MKKILVFLMFLFIHKAGFCVLLNSGTGVKFYTHNVWTSTNTFNQGLTSLGNIDAGGYKIVNATFGYTGADFSTSTNTVVLWRFDDVAGSTTTDNSGNGNTGILTGCTWNTTSQKWGNSAITLNGSSDKITFTPLTTLQTSSITITCWVRIDADVSGTDTIISKAGASTTKSFWLATNNNTNTPNFSYSTNGSNSSYNSAYSMNSALPLGIWTMLTITYNGVFTKYYMDDRLDAIRTQSITGPLYSSVVSSVCVGCLYDGAESTNFLTGKVDSIIIENGVWTAEQVRRKFLSGENYYNRLNNMVLPYKNYIVFETSTTAYGNTYDDAKLGVWAGHPGIFGTNFFIRAPKGQLRAESGGTSFAACNIGELAGLENGVVGEGKSMDVRCYLGTGQPAITWTTASQNLNLAGAVQIGGNLFMQQFNVGIGSVPVDGNRLVVGAGNATMVVNNTNVGIGTSVPVSKLDVRGDLSFGNASSVIRSSTSLGIEISTTTFTNGYSRVKNSWHVVGGTVSVSNTIAISSSAVWYKVTNAGNNLIQTSETPDGFSVVGDSIVFANKGDYDGSKKIAYSGNNGADWSIRFLNVNTGATTMGSVMPSTTGDTNVQADTNPVYFESVVAGDPYIIQVRRDGGSGDFTVKAIKFYIKYLHE